MIWEILAKTKSIREQVKDTNGGADAGNAPLQGDIKNIIDGIIAVVGIVAVIVIILGGVTYATSQGDPSKVTKGKKIMITGIVGLIIVILAFAIVNFVLGALLK